MVNAASAAVSARVRLAGALMPSGGCAAATQESAVSRGRKMAFMRCLSLRHAERDVGDEDVLCSGATDAGGTEPSQILRRTNPTGIRVSAGVVRIAHALDAA